MKEKLITIIKLSLRKRQTDYKFWNKKQQLKKKKKKKTATTTTYGFIFITSLSFARVLLGRAGVVVKDVGPLSLRSSLVGTGRVARTMSIVWGASTSLEGSLGATGG